MNASLTRDEGEAIGEALKVYLVLTIIILVMKG